MTKEPILNKEKHTQWQLNCSYTSLPKRFYSFGKESRFPEPSLIILNEPLLYELGLENVFEGMDESEKAQILAGNKVPESACLIHQAYAGHQYAHFTMLGDGRAILIGEQKKPDGTFVDIQIKGNGRSVFSRGGDGRATLGPMLREYLISEAMHALGIPSTRSLAVIKTGETVQREKALPGATLTRVASSHIRVGTFEFAAMGESSDVRALADYAIARHYPHILEEKEEQKYRLFLRNVIQRQASLIAKWQSVGFIHGVMNTDNMTISGESIDFGPCAFMDQYDPMTVFSSIDKRGRYRYENQPPVAQWNLARFAETLLPLLDDDVQQAVAIANEEIERFPSYYEQFRLSIMRDKLGLSDEQEDDKAFFDKLFSLMQLTKADYTNTFVRLTTLAGNLADRILDGTQELFEHPDFLKWLDTWTKRRGESTPQIVEKMQHANPFIIPRNYIVEKVLQASIDGDLAPFKSFLEAIQNPFDYHRSEEYQRIESVDPSYRTYCGT